MASKNLIKLKANKGLVARYRDLLREDWNAKAFDGAMRLALDQLQASGHGLRARTTKARRGSGVKRYPIPANASEHLVEFLESLNAQLLPSVPEKLPERTSQNKLRLGEKAALIGYILTLQSRADLSGAIGLFRDVQSLLFNLTLHVLVEELRTERMTKEIDWLLNVLYAHTLVAWNDDPGHRLFLQGQLYETVHPGPGAHETLLLSWQATDPSDHDYLTKAQGYWSELIEAGELAVAKNFVLQFHRHCPPSALPEVQRLLDATYEAAQRESAKGVLAS